MNKQGLKRLKNVVTAINIDDPDDVRVYYGKGQWRADGFYDASIMQTIEGKRSHHKGYTFSVRKITRDELIDLAYAAGMAAKGSKSRK